MIVGVVGVRTFSTQRRAPSVFFLSFGLHHHAPPRSTPPQADLIRACRTFDYPFHDRDVLVTACGRICMLPEEDQHLDRPRRTAPRHQGGRRRHLDRQLHATTISASSIWSKDLATPRQPLRARGCHPCLRDVLLPICPGRTKLPWRRGRDFEPAIPLRVCRISSAVLSTTQPPLQALLTGPSLYFSVSCTAPVTIA